MDIIENKDIKNNNIELVEYVVERQYNKYLSNGYWKNEKPHGHGQLFKDNLLMYDGEFLNGKSHGYGTLYKYYDTNMDLSEYFKGYFFEGYLQGEFTGYWLSTNKKYLEANFSEASIHGVVTYYHKNGLIRATGMKTNGQYGGEWTFYYSNGKLHGKVSYIMNRLYKGVFYENDEKIEGAFNLNMIYGCIYSNSMKSYISYATITNLAKDVYEIVNYGFTCCLLYMKNNDTICIIDEYEVVKPYIYENIMSDDYIDMPIRKYKMFINNEWKPASVKRHFDTPFTYYTAELIDEDDS